MLRALPTVARYTQFRPAKGNSRIGAPLMAEKRPAWQKSASNGDAPEPLGGL